LGESRAHQTVDVTVFSRDELSKAMLGFSHTLSEIAPPVLPRPRGVRTANRSLRSR
jgi:hypothetical protein